MKAAIVYNLALFTNWPGNAMPVGSAFNACFLNAPELRQGMQELAVTTLLGRRLELQTVQGGDSLRDCELLVVGAMPREKWNAARNSLAGSAILTVSDQFEVQDGLMIALKTEGTRIVFDADNSAARAVGLVMSSKLLRLARNVR
ncbi:YfiR family protein [Lacisediminimonas sp.]|uniref:YfiR family protein n=1 Tax=Lacisediminimonas sp. TaxID=3060582 RepID=UPI002717F617|nr:YfiR family protein [Lacisediminimonas sp.]MDO8301349.1 YfiR family protein [Lacisediminimonas sp.]